MSSNPRIDDATRAAILSEPDAILDDNALMRALVDATDAAKGDNIIDMRGLAMRRLESRLDRLEDTHRSVIAAAYDNVAGTNQIHRAVLALLAPVDVAQFVAALTGEVADILSVDAVRVVLEAAPADPAPQVPADWGTALQIVPQGFVGSYVQTSGRARLRAVTLRAVAATPHGFWGTAPVGIASEACLTLDLGADRPPALLAIGTGDPAMFAPGQGTDLLEFFGGVVGRTLRRWLP